MPSISVDYAISEKEKNFITVAGDFFWTDIGDWREVWANSKKDNKSNVIISGDEPGGEVLTIDTTDTLVHSDGRMVAVVGLDNIVVVDTEDALLVCSKSHAQDVKKIVEKLKEEKRTELL
jgi:mannose-1-phosphate guanylyltransferase